MIIPQTITVCTSDICMQIGLKSVLQEIAKSKSIEPKKLQEIAIKPRKTSFSRGAHHFQKA